MIEDQDGMLQGVEAVVDKDLAGAVLARIIKARTYLILTDVENAYINYRRKNQMALEEVEMQEMKSHLEDGQFAEGSMGPKVEAALRFLEWGGERSIITSSDRAMDAMEGTAGTQITSPSAKESRERIMATAK